MKTHIIKTPTAELLIVELLENTKSWEFLDGNFWADDKQLFINGFTPFHTLLGKPDEIKEEDVKDLVKQSIHTGLFAHYVKGIPVNVYCYKTAKESLLSLLETEIYWDVNPKQFGIYAMTPTGIKDTGYDDWYEAESRTFDKNRTLIFLKN